MQVSFIKQEWWAWPKVFHRTTIKPNRDIKGYRDLLPWSAQYGRESGKQRAQNKQNAIRKCTAVNALHLCLRTTSGCRHPAWTRPCASDPGPLWSGCSWNFQAPHAHAQAHDCWARGCLGEDLCSTPLRSRLHLHTGCSASRRPESGLDMWRHQDFTQIKADCNASHRPESELGFIQYHGQTCNETWLQCFSKPESEPQVKI